MAPSARAVLGALALSFAVSSCGGGGGGGGSPVDPPATVSYAQPAVVYESHLPVAPNTPTVTGGTPTLYTVAPALPAGLSLDPDTGVLSGTPTGTQAATDHVVTASNAGGSAQATVNVRVFLNRGYDLSAKASFSDDEIRFFLGRTHFLGRDAEFQAVKAAGLPAYVDSMVDFGATPSLDAEAAKYLLNTSDPPGLEGGFPSNAQVARYWEYLMTANPNPFQEVLAFFWHDHFASAVPQDEDRRWWGPRQIQLWRTEGNGNLRTLLVDMARDWVMLQFLDGILSTKDAPNENFAREFFELFTLGRDNGYTQADIVEAARAFTGYRTTFNSGTGQSSIVFSTSRHDPNPKTLFATQGFAGYVIAGQNVTDDYQAVVDITVDHRPVAEFVCRRLFEHFCYPSAPQEPIDAMAAILRGANYELKPLLAALFRSEAFFSPASRAGIVKGPVEQIVGFVRATGLVPVDPRGGSDPPNGPSNMLRTLDGTLTTAAQQPTQPPSVNGWPVASEWLSAQNMLDRANAVLACIADRTDQGNAGIDVASILPPFQSPDDANVVDGLATLLRVSLSPTERQTCIDYLNTQVGSGGVPSPTPSPFDRTNPTHVSERVRGLLYVLAQHPTFGVR